MKGRNVLRFSFLFLAIILFSSKCKWSWLLLLRDSRVKPHREVQGRTQGMIYQQFPPGSLFLPWCNEMEASSTVSYTEKQTDCKGRGMHCTSLHHCPSGCRLVFCFLPTFMPSRQEPSGVGWGDIYLSHQPSRRTSSIKEDPFWSSLHLPSFHLHPRVFIFCTTLPHDHKDRSCCSKRCLSPLLDRKKTLSGTWGMIWAWHSKTQRASEQIPRWLFCQANGRTRKGRTKKSGHFHSPLIPISIFQRQKTRKNILM